MVHHPRACLHPSLHDALLGQFKKQCQSVLLTILPWGSSLQ